MAFIALKKLLEPFGIKHFYTDGWGAYQRHLEANVHSVFIVWTIHQSNGVWIAYLGGKHMSRTLPSEYPPRKTTPPIAKYDRRSRELTLSNQAI